MYQNKFVVAIKSGGKVLREAKDLVHLPFGSEFSVLVKNLNSRRAKFTLHIDGQDVLDGTEIIVDGNKEVEMKRFIRNGNMNEGNAFKFIERTKSIEDGPRGVKVDDGIVRVEFWFEQEAPTYTTTYHRDVWYSDYYPTIRRSFISGQTYNSGTAVSNVKLKSASASIARSLEASGGAAEASYSATNAVGSNSATATSASASINEVGITVPGSKVEQKFQTVYGFRSETQSHVIVIRLAGKTGEIEIVAPVTVKSKQKCTTCGHMNKATSKFCSDCGTALDLV